MVFMEKEIKYIPTECICPNVYQPRKTFNEDTIAELSESIKAYGIIQPLSVRKVGENEYELVAGERRLRAAKRIGLEQVPAIIVNISNRDSACIALLENLQREDLNFMEEAEAYYNLINQHEYTQEQLAQVIGKKQSTIANKLRLLKLDGEVRNIVLQNKLTERHARALLKLPNVDSQKSILKVIIEKSLNVKKSEELIEKELMKKASEELAAAKKKRIKVVFSPRIYINTIKQVFDKYGIDANFNSKDLGDSIRVTVTIPKK